MFFFFFFFYVWLFLYYRLLFWVICYVHLSLLIAQPLNVIKYINLHPYIEHKILEFIIDRGGVSGGSTSSNSSSSSICCCSSSATLNVTSLTVTSRSQWPRRLSHGPAPARSLELWVRTQPRMSSVLSVVCRVRYRTLATGRSVFQRNPIECGMSDWMWSWSLDNEEAMAQQRMLRHLK
jgi:hypothetical protein